MDNCGPHGNEIEDPRGQVEIVFLPPNCTFVYQPMDAGIIAWVKKKYCYKLLKIMVDVFDRQDELAGLASAMPHGTAGVMEGTKAHLYDAMKILDEVWKNLDEELITCCWARTLLAPSQMAAFNNTHGKYVVGHLHPARRLMKSLLVFQIWMYLEFIQ